MGKDLQGEKSLTFLPVAHLSPVCAYAVKKTLEETAFDTLFVEIPKEAKNLLPALIDERTKLPVSFLFRNGGDEIFLPFTEYSPEYVAVKTASTLGKKIVFIDGAEFATAYGRSETAVDTIENVTGGAYGSADFFRAMDALAFNFAGEISPREIFMLREIESSGYNRGIVVAGAVHCANLKNALKNGADGAVKPSVWEGKCYIIPYIPEGGSVMRYGYNTALFKRLGTCADPFTAAASDCLIKLSNKVKADYPFEHVPVTDVINTLVHMRMLAELRGKRFAGFTELSESAQSVISKGEENSVKQHAFKSVTESIPEGELAPGEATPLAEDFLRRLKEYSIRGDAGSRITLQILENPAHRSKSAFLRRVELLIEDGFAAFESGADYARGKDLNKVREVWRTNGVARAVTRLTYVSHLGASVAEAARHKLDELIAEAEGAGAPALTSLYVQAYFLRLDDKSAFEKLSESIFHISEFEAAVSALSNLVYLIEIKRIFEGSRTARDVAAARSVYAKALELLSGLWLSDSGEKNAVALARLNNITRTADYLEESRLMEALSSAPSYAEPCLSGCVCALTGKGGGVLQKLESYVVSATASDSAMFFLGCALGDRGLLTDKRIIKAAGAFVEKMTREEFMDASPSLRYAFSFLKLTERKTVREIIGTIYGEDEPLFFADGTLLLQDEYLGGQIELYGLTGEIE